MQVVHERADTNRAGAGDGVGHQSYRRIFKVRRDLGQVIGVDAHIRVADHQDLISRGSGKADELIDLWVEPRLPALPLDPNPLRKPRGKVESDGVGGVAFILDAEEQLIAGVMESCESFEIGNQIIVDTAKRLEDGNGREGGGAPRRRPHVAQQHHQLRGDEQQAESGECKQGYADPPCHAG